MGNQDKPEEGQTALAASPSGALEPRQPRSLAVAQTGIRTGRQFAGFMSALMSDLIEGRVTPQVGNAACNAGGKLLKVVEMQYKYGTTPATPPAAERVLDLAPSVEEMPLT